MKDITNLIDFFKLDIEKSYSYIDNLSSLDINGSPVTELNRLYNKALREYNQ